MTRSSMAIAFPSLLFCALSASADPVIISFTGQGGTIGLLDSGDEPHTYNAANVPITHVYIQNAPKYNGTYTVTGSCAGSPGYLTFNTSDGSIEIFGAIPDIGVTSPEVLLSGTDVWTFSFDKGDNDESGIFRATGPDVKGAALLAAIGLPDDTQFTYGQMELTTSVDHVIAASKVENRAVSDGGLTAVLLGGALAGVEAVRRRLRL